MAHISNWLHAPQLDSNLAAMEVKQAYWNSLQAGQYVAQYLPMEEKMTSETFKEQLALKFLDKYLSEENVHSSDTDVDDVIESANQIAESVYLYVNAMLAAHEGQKIEVKPQVQAVPKTTGSGLLGFKNE